MKIITAIARTIEPDSLKMDLDMLGILQKDLAKAINISTPQLCRWVNGVTIVPEQYIDDIEKYINARKKVVAEYLIKEHEEDKKNDTY